jgi:neopullulanase
MKRFVLVAGMTILAAYSFSQVSSYKCYPTNWWVGMKWNKIQVMVHGKNVADYLTINTSGARRVLLAQGVYLTQIHNVENHNYIFLDITIDPDAKPCTFKLPFKNPVLVNYQLRSRRTGNGTLFAEGVTGKDFIYLIMPDRFSDGDTTNDRIPGLRDQSLDRDSVYARHGGDLKGIQNHLNYLQSLGVTTLWLNPVVENDMPNRTEHGYAATDNYAIDPRLGGSDAYQDLINAIHRRHMKIIGDVVYNHVGLYHFTVQDPPMKNWLHVWPEYTQTSAREQTIFDPHGSKADENIMVDGWFSPQMPDLNQSNPYVANFLIQYAIWTVETFGIDGWRIDTYPYNDLSFMNKCNQALVNEFPKITMFGETWEHGVINQSYFVQNIFNIPVKSNLQGTTDFQSLWAITDALTRKNTWTNGVIELYNTLAKDFVYKNADREVIFFDNHDMARFFSVVGENITKYRTAITWLLTCRGIPQLYYGDELGLTGFTYPNDGHVRQDFPGGWASDRSDKFLRKDRTAKEDSIWDYISTLANFRKNSPALTKGKMMQYVPAGGVYVYFRYDPTQTIMVAMNTSDETKTIQPTSYLQRIKGFSKMRNIMTGKLTDLSPVTLDSMESGIWELLK